jgi:uncharacterized protein YraI
VISSALKSIVAIVFVAVLASPLFAQTARGTYTITADVPLRSGPGADQEVITVLPRGIQVNVVGKEGYWLRIESKHGGRPGYIDEQFARRTTQQASAAAPARDSGVSAAGPYRTLKEVALREGPGTKHSVVARIPPDVKVNVTRAEGDWLRVESNRGGKPGYVDRRDVERLTEP